MDPADRIVLDSSAVIAFLQGETGADVVGRRLTGAGISAVNAAECVDVIARRGAPMVRAIRAVADLDLVVIPCDWEIAVAAAAIHGETRPWGLSLGDSICLATVRSWGTRALTTDRAWLKVKVGVDIEVVR